MNFLDLSTGKRDIIFAECRSRVSPYDYYAGEIPLAAEMFWDGPIYRNVGEHRFMAYDGAWICDVCGKRRTAEPSAVYHGPFGGWWLR